MRRDIARKEEKTGRGQEEEHCGEWAPRFSIHWQSYLDLTGVVIHLHGCSQGSCLYCTVMGSPGTSPWHGGSGKAWLSATGGTVRLAFYCFVPVLFQAILFQVGWVLVC